MEKENNPEGGGGVIGLFAWLVEDNAIGLFEGRGVVTELKEGAEEGDQNVRGGAVNCFPN